jgi:formamidopyrimidine-DNA glycosylase
MPELPEVETIAKQLDAVLVGRVFESITVYREKSAQSELGVLEGKRVWGVGRKAKTIIIKLQATSNRRQVLFLLIHLKMTGQLIFQLQATGDKPQATRVVGGHPTLDWVNELPSKHTRIEARFTDGSRLFFNDQRVFGWWRVVTSDKLQATSDKLPPDVVDQGFTVEYLTQVLKKSHRAVKLVLLDQSKIGGLGNIYVGDALWKAGAKPTRRAATLKRTEIQRLHRACVEVIERGIVVGGASESTYKHINGMGGNIRKNFWCISGRGETVFA